jgi:hypothetical protein
LGLWAAALTLDDLRHITAAMEDPHRYLDTTRVGSSTRRYPHSRPRPGASPELRDPEPLRDRPDDERLPLSGLRIQVLRIIMYRKPVLRSIDLQQSRLPADPT